MNHGNIQSINYHNLKSSRLTLTRFINGYAGRIAAKDVALMHAVFDCRVKNIAINYSMDLIRLFLVGTDTAKDLIFERLNLTEHGERYCHFPITYDEDYFKGLCAEKKVITYARGRKVKRYEKITQSARNEPLDCRVYNIAALYLLNPKYEVLHKRMMLKQDKKYIAINVNEKKPHLEDKIQVDKTIIAFEAQKPAEAILQNKPPKRIKRKSSFQVVW